MALHCRLEDGCLKFRHQLGNSEVRSIYVCPRNPGISRSDPHTWPWIFYVWLAFAVAGSVRSLWRRWRNQSAKSWLPAIRHNGVNSCRCGRSSIFSIGPPLRTSLHGIKLFLFCWWNGLYRSIFANVRFRGRSFGICPGQIHNN